MTAAAIDHDLQGIPLAVRSPYLSTWLWGGANDRGGNLATQFATFWNGNNLPWCGTLLINGITYTWMGVPSICSPNTGRGATQLSLNLTATSTTFVMRAGPVDVTVQFLSPITPNDMVRQTLPYSYMHVSVSPNDGQSHTVKVGTACKFCKLLSADSMILALLRCHSGMGVE